MVGELRSFDLTRYQLKSASVEWDIKRIRKLTVYKPSSGLHVAESERVIGLTLCLRCWTRQVLKQVR